MGERRRGRRGIVLLNEAERDVAARDVLYAEVGSALERDGQRWQGGTCSGRGLASHRGRPASTEEDREQGCGLEVSVT